MCLQKPIGILILAVALVTRAPSGARGQQSLPRHDGVIGGQEFLDSVGSKSLPYAVEPSSGLANPTEGTGAAEPAVEAAEGRLSDAAPAVEGAPKDEPAPYVVGSDLNMKASWHNGVEIESANKDFRLHIGGRTQFDGVWLDGENDLEFGPGGLGDLQDGANFRRARLRADGVMYEIIEWAAEYDFANSVNDDPLAPATPGNVIHVTAPTDLWFTIRELPWVGNMRIGNFKEPIGFEHLTSSRYLNFMERSFNQDAFTGPFNNGFSPGLMIFNWTENQRGTWALAAVKNTTNVFAYGLGEGEYATTGRVTWLPYYDEPSQGRYLWHVGVSGSIRDPDNGQVRLRARPALRNGPPTLNPVLANTGLLGADTQYLLGVETAVVYGPWLLQAEYMGSPLTDTIAGGVPIGDTYFHGGYVEALFFLTGEHRVYDRKIGTIGRVVPHENFFVARGAGGRCVGRGAWQVGARYSQLDLEDTGIDGGLIQDFTLGLNWFLNPNMKMQWNYVYTHRDAPTGGADGNIHGVGMRVAHDF